MNVPKLIATAAKRTLEGYPSAIGVRLSPISISAADLLPIAEEVQRQFGPGIYVAASAPSEATAAVSRT